MLFLHGILGNRSNLRSVARRFVEARPDWGAALVDLRMHGDSQDRPPPHTLSAAARDLDALDDELPGPVRGALGHSFGGKVALEWLAGRDEPMDEAWIVDALPGARDDRRGSETTLSVLEALASLSFPMPSRDAFVAALEERGFDQGVGRWLAMSLEREDDESYRLRLDLDAIHALLDDYFAHDLWSVVEEAPAQTEMHLVLGNDSPVFDGESRARAEAAARAKDNVHCHVITGAGHWVHVDAPDRLLELMTGGTNRE